MLHSETMAQIASCEPEPGRPFGEVRSNPPPAPVNGSVARSFPAEGLKTITESSSNNRILIVDDNPAIHQDFRKILSQSRGHHQSGLLQAEAALFGEAQSVTVAREFELESAHQGKEALQKVKDALAAGRPYAMAFVDVRMPPGWDGIETVTRIWQIYPELQVVICTAYSDYSWEEMIARLGSPNNLVILKKPFDNVEVLQLAHAFTRKWELNRQAQLKLGELAEMVASRTSELEHAYLELKREVNERVELERQFRQAQKMEAVGQLAAGVAHDFNNILTVIHGHASMLFMRLGESGAHAKSVLEIRQSAERASNLVRQLLMFSRKQIMQFRNVELGEVIRSVSGMLRQLVGEHISLETECAPGLTPIYADRGMIEQVIVNLTVNARDAMPKGGRIVIKSGAGTLSEDKLQIQSEAPSGDFVCLSVADTGCGIDKQALNHLFEPFFTTKEVGKGTGLGLATVYGIIKQHQGWTDVQSECGVGTTFRVFFPVSAQLPQRLPEPRAEFKGRNGTETILIAEDETPLREMVSEVLHIHGYQVIEASSGPAALEAWRRQPNRIDLLLTDMVMPGGMMGSDLAAELKRSNPKLKVIFTTGYTPSSGDGHDTLREGVNFLAKPYSPDTLAEIVRKSLDG